MNITNMTPHRGTSKFLAFLNMYTSYKGVLSLQDFEPNIFILMTISLPPEGRQICQVPHIRPVQEFRYKVLERHRS